MDKIQLCLRIQNIINYIEFLDRYKDKLKEEHSESLNKVGEMLRMLMKDVQKEKENSLKERESSSKIPMLEHQNLFK